MKKEMLINCLQPEEIRIAILEDGILEELYVERASHESYVGNIYKGRIVNIEPSIQAAFVDFGVGRNGFLHVSDVEPAYYSDLERGQRNDRGRGGDRDRGRGGDRGGRGRGGRPQSRDYDDYDRPKRGPRDGGGGGYRQPPPERGVEDEVHQIPVVSPEYIASQTRHELPPSAEDGPDIIVEEIVTDDDFYEGTTIPPEPPDFPASSRMEEEREMEPTSFEEERQEVELPREPQSLFDDPPQTIEPPRERVFGEGIDIDEPPPVRPAPVPVDAEATEPTAAEEDAADEGKAPRRGRRKPAAKSTSRAKKPRKSTKKDDGDEPKPRPMDSTERRTDEHDPSLGPIEPRPASDISDDELSFSMAPRSDPKPAPRPEPRIEEPRSQEPRSQEPRSQAPLGNVEPSGDAPRYTEPVEESLDEPIEPPMSRFEEEETMVEIVEEEKALEAEIESGASGDEGPPIVDLDEEQGEFEDFSQPPPRSRGDRDRGGRGRDDRGGRGRDDRGGRGRDDRGRRGGPGGGRDRGRAGFDRDRGRGPGAGFGRPKPHIEDIFKRGQEVLVKVIKEGIGTKGPTLTTYISIAGRYLVLMPGLERIGVSRKIEDDEIRRRLREILRELKPPRGIGFIIRTAGQDRNQKELQSDLAYLSRLWQVVVSRIKKQKSPSEIYRESDMVTRTIRDNFTSDIDTIWVDERGAYDAAKEFMQAVMPRYADRIKFYDGTEPMFHKYGIEQEIARIQLRHVPLPHGGSIVIDQTEAMVAIDVNSGNFRAGSQNAEDTAYQMNLHAAREIARQLRLRDLGGVIANDFIDMREDRHRRGVEKALHDAVQRDRARTKILRISQFGIIEMTRQRIRPSLKRSVYQDCKHCHATGHVKTGESVSIDVMRMLQLAVHREIIQRIEIRVHDEVALYLQNKKRKDIVALEEAGNKSVTIHSAGAAVSPEHLEFMCFDNNGNEVKFATHDEPPPRPTRRR